MFLECVEMELNHAAELQARRARKLNIVQFNGPRGEKEKQKYNAVISCKSLVLSTAETIKQTKEKFRK
jgi:hypothetical protein